MDNQFLEYIKAVIPAAILGIFAAFVSIVSGDKKIEYRTFFGTILLAILVVAIIDAGLKEVGFKSMNIWAISCYMGGYCSKSIVEIFKRRFLSTLKAKIDNNVASKKED